MVEWVASAGLTLPFAVLGVPNFFVPCSPWAFQAISTLFSRSCGEMLGLFVVVSILTHLENGAGASESPGMGQMSGKLRAC